MDLLAEVKVVIIMPVAEAAVVQAELAADIQVAAELLVVVEEVRQDVVATVELQAVFVLFGQELLDNFLQLILAIYKDLL
jgi:hypothetical protein